MKSCVSRIAVLALMLLTVFACSPGIAPTPTPDTALNAGAVTLPALSAVTTTGEPYPVVTAPSSTAYPESANQAILPTGYPEVTVVAPGGQIDESSLLPGGQPGEAPMTMIPGDSTPSPEMSALLSAIAMNLSRHTDIPVDEIVPFSLVPMTWPNAGLGCPDPDRMYAEVLVEGLLVTMQARDGTFDYHTNGLRSFVLCQDGQPVSAGEVP